MKNERLRFFVRGLVFLAALALLLTVAERVTVDKNSAAQTLAFYEEPKDSLDVLFLGSSRVMCGIYPLQLMEEQGIAAFDCAGSAQVIAQSYFQLREALTRQSPRLVVVEVSTVSNGNLLTGDPNFVHAQLDYFRSLPVRMEAIRTLIPKDDRMEFYFPLLRFHSRVADLDRRDLIPVVDGGKGCIVYEGTTAGAGTPEWVPPEDKSPVEEIPAEYLRKIVALCREQGAEVLFLLIPANKPAELQRVHNGAADLAEELGVPYLDLRRCVEEMGFDYEQDLYDATHCNSGGAAKVTAYVGEYLKAHYDLPDRREETK